MMLTRCVFRSGILSSLRRSDTIISESRIQSTGSTVGRISQLVLD